MRRSLIVLFWLVLCPAALAAGQARPLADDEAVEQRLVGIADELRCLVCQNESLAGSRAPLAEDLRRELRELIREGRSDEEIMSFMVSRYGNFVRYRPPFDATTLLLWIGPFVLLVGGLAGLAVLVRRRAGQADTTLDPAQRAEAERLLDEAKREAQP